MLYIGSWLSDIHVLYADAVIRSDGVPRRESEVTKRAVEGDVTENLRREKYEYRERMGEEEEGDGEG